MGGQTYKSNDTAPKINSQAMFNTKINNKKIKELISKRLKRNRTLNTSKIKSES